MELNEKSKIQNNSPLSFKFYSHVHSNQFFFTAAKKFKLFFSNLAEFN